MLQFALFCALRAQYIRSITFSSCAPLHVAAFAWCEDIADAMPFTEDMAWEVVKSVRADYNTRLAAHCII